MPQRTTRAAGRTRRSTDDERAAVVFDLHTPPERLGLALLAGPVSTAPAGEVVAVPSLSEVERAPRAAVAVVLSTVAPGDDYRLDLAVRVAADRGIAALVLPGRPLLPRTAARLADRAGVPVLGTAEADGPGLLLRLDRFVRAGAAEMLTRGTEAVEAARCAAGRSGSEDPVGEVLLAAGRALGCRLHVIDDPHAGPSVDEVLVVDGVAADLDDEATRVALPAVAALVARQRELELGRRFAPSMTRAELIVQVVLADRARLPALVQQAHRVDLPLHETHVAAWVDLAIETEPETVVWERQAVGEAEMSALSLVHQRPGLWHVARLGTRLLLTCTERRESATLRTRVREELEKVLARLREGGLDGVTGGIGTPQVGAEGLRQSAAEARVAADAAAATGRAGTVVDADASGLRRVLADLYASPLSRRLLADLLAPLDALDGDRARTGVETLSAYLDAQGSPTRAARTLHLHPNAVAYRLRWITDALGADLDDPDVRFALQLACRVRLLAG